jgi:hypothetical protein
MLLYHIYRYNLAFSNNNSEYFNESDEDIFGNRIIILKRVKSLKQLRRTEKELVKLNYKKAIMKGFTLKGIQQYIATKTKIWIEWSGLGMVLPYGQGTLCVCRGNQKMH